MQVTEVTATSGLVSWGPGRPADPVWMFQIQYNSSEDETPIYRIVPASSHHFLLKHLVPGADYDLCLLALSPAAGPSDLTATRLLGCAHFSTLPATPLCHALQAHVLGGTLTVAVGVCWWLPYWSSLWPCWFGAGGPGMAASPQAQPRPISDQWRPQPHTQDAPTAEPPPRPQRSCSLDLGDAGGCYGYARRLGGAWARRSHSVHGGLLGAGCRGVGGSAERLEESVV